jgi:hypothetical protein
MKKLQYRIIRDEWVNIISITPINKVSTRYDGLNLIIDNEISYVILYLDDKEKLTSDIIGEYHFESDIRVI